MPWKNATTSFAINPEPEVVRVKVDQLPLMTSLEPASVLTPQTDHEIESDVVSSKTKGEHRHISGSNNNHRHSRTSRLSYTPSNTSHITTVTIGSPSKSTQQPVVSLKQPRSNTQPSPNSQNVILNSQQHYPIISYEKNKSVRIVVREPSAAEFQKRNSQLKDYNEEGEIVSHRESFRNKKGVISSQSDVNGWIRVACPDITSGKVALEEEGVKVRPLMETWRTTSNGASRSSVLDEPSSSDDCQRSTSTLVHPNSLKISTSSCGTQRGFVSLICGTVIVIGSAICLRLPGLLITYGPGSFLSAFVVCLLFIAIPLAYIESGLAQFSSNSIIGIWSLVPLARGIGWSTVVGCLYWGAATAGLASPWLHYIIAQYEPDVLQVPDSNCRFQNLTDFDAVNYYRYCVYNLTGSLENELDLRLTWSLPAGLISVLAIASISVAGGPVLFAFVSGMGSLMALTGYAILLYLGVSQFVDKSDIFHHDWRSLIQMLVPDPETLIKPQVWLAALSQAFLSLGPGVGLLLNHSANNVFRHPLKRHLCYLTTLTLVTTAAVTVTTVLEVAIFYDHLQLSNISGFGPPLDNTNEDIALLKTEDLEERNTTGFNNFQTTTITDDERSCVLFPYSISDVSCTEMDSSLVGGVPFIISSHILSTSVHHNSYILTAVLKTLVYLGFLGAGIATSCVCMHVGVVAAREARSLPPAVAALILMAVLSIVAAPMSTQTGAALIYTLDFYVLMPGLLWPPLVSMIALTTCHGVTKIRKDMTFMLESVVSWVWLPVWALVLPLLLMGVTVWAFYEEWERLGLVEGPMWHTSIVWSLRAGLLISIPATAAVVINSQLAYGLKDKVASSLQSSREWGDWGPQDPIEHHNWRRWREDETRSYASLERRLASARPLTYTHSTLSSTSSSTLARLRAKYRNQAIPMDI